MYDPDDPDLFDEVGNLNTRYIAKKAFKDESEGAGKWKRNRATMEARLGKGLIGTKVIEKITNEPVEIVDYEKGDYRIMDREGATSIVKLNELDIPPQMQKGLVRPMPKRSNKLSSLNFNLVQPDMGPSGDILNPYWKIQEEGLMGKQARLRSRVSPRYVRYRNWLDKEAKKKSYDKEHQKPIQYRIISIEDIKD